MAAKVNYAYDATSQAGSRRGSGSNRGTHGGRRQSTVGPRLRFGPGLRARLRRGEPGSVDLGREKDFLLGVMLDRLALPGEKVWVTLEDPGWWPADIGSARGDGVRVGEMGGGRGPGEGVLARGDRGIWPADFLREGEWRFLVLMHSLCLRPCREEGRVEEEEEVTGAEGEVREQSAEAV